jgi:hypothetical protein
MKELKLGKISLSKASSSICLRTGAHLFLLNCSNSLLSGIFNFFLQPDHSHRCTNTLNIFHLKTSNIMRIKQESFEFKTAQYSETMSLKEKKRKQNKAKNNEDNKILIQVSCLPSSAVPFTNHLDDKTLQ